MPPHGSQAAHTVTSLSAAADASGSEAAPLRQNGIANLVHRVPIESLDAGDSPRSGGVDHEHVKVLAENLGELPPILVHRPTMRIIDGVHRLNARRLGSCTTVDVVYFDGSEEEAFLLSVESNIRHGLPLSLQDRKKAALRILFLFPEWSNRAIAARVGLDHKTVGSLRRRQGDPAVQPNIRVGLDGKVRPLNATEGRLRAQEAIAQNPEASLRDIAGSAGISVETARDVRRRMELGNIETACENGGGKSRTSVATRGISARQTEIITTLESLKKDPAVRYSDDGRALVRWLESRLIHQEDTDRVMRIPAHQAEKVAAVARAVAARWSEIAARLESHPSSSA
ncbi:ParB/RepB/Spo0J family partition protein [Streptomyces sp. NPDC057474]|uniref:ParB/RepB/Spo0J family partition protein n=1 Tax=Streptomyces sp. NPDC057474 TaxID=3346144 RepID=UPI0036BFA88F